MPELQTYNGGCHCGAVRFTIEMPTVEKVFACNCSICSRAGWLLAFSPAAGFTLVSGEDTLSDYQFGKKRIHHVFCRTCGVRSFGHGPGHDGSEWISVNVRCLDGLDAEAYPVERFDGASL